MDDFFRSNPGLSSRVAHHIDFPDYDVDELMAIARPDARAAQNYVFGPGAEDAFRAYLERRVHAAALRPRPQRPQLDRPRAAAPGEPAVRRRRQLSRDELMTITPDDILQSSVFAEDREPEDDARPARRLQPDAAPLDHPRRRRRLRRRQDDAHPRARPRARRGATSRTSAPTTTTATTAGSAPSANITPLASRTATTWTSWRSTSRTCAPGEPILKPVYQHQDGTFGAARATSTPSQFTVVEGLLGYYTEELRDSFDVRVYLAPPEELRRKWKVQRDCSRRGYTTDQVLVRARPARARLGGVHPPAAALRRHRRLVPAGRRGDQEHLDAELTLRAGARAPGPALGASTARRATGITITRARRRAHLCDPGRHRRASGAEAIEEAIWERHALREPPALRAARRVHDRHRPAPLGVARARSSC